MKRTGELYTDACSSGDLAAFVADLNATALRSLHAAAVEAMKFNQVKGGIPAVIKWACVLEASNRFLK